MPTDILSFWFSEIQPAQWWRVDPSFDAQIRTRFGQTHAAAVAGELYVWRTTPEGRLAEIIVLDQFSRNLYRGTPKAFAADSMALALSQEAIAAEADVLLPIQQRVFLYMPFIHSESRLVHQIAEPLFQTEGLKDHYKSALQHKSIIDRFGRYPHRNACAAIYQRQFEVIPNDDLTIEERRLILVKYREFMEANGYVGMPRQDTGEIVDFRIRDARSRVLSVSRITDAVSTRIDSKGQLSVQLSRITSYPPDDFSTEYLRNFAELTQKYLQESSGKQLILRAMPSQ